MTSGSSAPPLDFAALLSREYRPARLSQLVPKERAKALPTKRSLQQQSQGGDQDGSGDEETAAGAHDKDHGKHAKFLHDLAEEHTEAVNRMILHKSKQEADEKAARLVLQLVSKTPAYTKHLQQVEATKVVDDSDLKSYIQKYPDKASSIAATPGSGGFAPVFHQVELGDWESKIMWKGYQEPDQPKSSGGARASSTSTSATSSSSATGGISAVSPNAIDAATLLKQRRNPFLEDLNFEDMISWSGSKEDARAKANKLPLILELGVAGQSIARHVLPSHRPIPCIKSDEYQRRMQADWNAGDVQSTAELSKGTLHADKEQMERLIKQRQEKRRQMAKDKTSRVTEAMGTLNVLGSGRGRTITSSLMGPGGTERTGRPSRHVGANASHDTEYIEQLDMVTNHVLVRDLGKVTLRQYHRPKLPLTVVRTTLIWQFAIRYLPSSKKGGPATTGAGDNSSSYQAMMIGTHAGAVSKAKLRSESDLSPTEGKLILLEYSEERPPIQMTKGMASKIVTYYRGDKTRCPVSAGGGDRPARRKRAGETAAETKKANAGNQNKPEKPPRLVGPNQALSSGITDWVGKPPKKTREDRVNEREKINILPEGVTEILHPKVHGPFIGEIEDGQSVTGLVSNLFVAPIFQHEPEQTDFLMILGRNSGASIAGRHETLNVVLRELPTSVYSVGQTEPRTRVFAPNTQGEKNFIGPFVSYQIARILSRSENREGHGLRFDELQERVLPNLELQSNNLRQRLKPVAIFDKNSNIWTTKRIGEEDYPGVDALGKDIAPEGVAAWEIACSATRRLRDLGIHTLFSGSHAVSSVGVTMVYLAGQVNASKELAKKMKKLADLYKKDKKNLGSLKTKFYEDASTELEAISKAMKRRHEVAKFIFQELQLAPWHLTGEFVDVHKKGEGTGMMKLTGLGDPSGIGEGYSFLREQDSKPTKSVGANSMQQNAQVKKITGTEDDLRKLTMKQMGKILQSYGMSQKHIATLKRWDRVHVIRDLSTKAASDGVGDGLERFARGEKLKLSEQKQMYRDRIQVIWKRQLASLSIDPSEGRNAGVDIGVGASEGGDGAAGRGNTQNKTGGGDKDDSDSDSDNEDFMADMEKEMMESSATKELVAAQTREAGGTRGAVSLGQLANARQDQALNKDARDYATLMQQRKEEEAAREGLSSLPKTDHDGSELPIINRKIIRRRVTKTYPDGRQVTTFKFIVHSEEVGQIMARLSQQKPGANRRRDRPEYSPDEKQIGHSIFEDEDDFEFSSRGRGHGLKRRGGRRGRGTAKAMPRNKDLQFGKFKTSTSKEQRRKKRKREEDDMEIYTSVSRRKGTSNRKERGSIRERRPHVIMADRLEAIRTAIESRPSSGPFHKPVNRRSLPQYYEKISNPIDLSTIRNKIQNYEYRLVDNFLKDFELMKSNAIKFNGGGSLIAEEGSAIFEVVKDKIEKGRAELTHLEEAVREQMSGKPKKRKKKGSAKASAGGYGGGDDDMYGGGGLELNLDFSESDSD